MRWFAELGCFFDNRHLLSLKIVPSILAVTELG